MRRTRGCDTKSHNEVVGFHAIIFLLLHPFDYKQVQVEKKTYSIVICIILPIRFTLLIKVLQPTLTPVLTAVGSLSLRQLIGSGSHTTA